MIIKGYGQNGVILDILKFNPNIGLCSYKFDKKTFTGLLKFLRKKTTILYFVFNGTYQESFAYDDTLETEFLKLMAVLKNKKQLQDITFKHCAFRSKQLRLFLRKVLPELQQSLTSLSLINCEIFPNSIDLLFSAIHNHKTITELNLSDNFLKKNECREISDALSKNNTLKILDLSLNLIKTKGVERIADALCVNSILTSLNLSNNNISYTAAASLNDMLKVNTSLTSLDLKDNRLSGDWSWFYGFAEDNFTLIELELGYDISGGDSRVSTKCNIQEHRAIMRPIYRNQNLKMFHTTTLFMMLYSHLYDLYYRYEFDREAYTTEEDSTETSETSETIETPIINKPVQLESKPPEPPPLPITTLEDVDPDEIILNEDDDSDDFNNINLFEENDDIVFMRTNSPEFGLYPPSSKRQRWD